MEEWIGFAEARPLATRGILKRRIDMIYEADKAHPSQDSVLAEPGDWIRTEYETLADWENAVTNNVPGTKLEPVHSFKRGDHMCYIYKIQRPDSEPTFHAVIDRSESLLDRSVEVCQELAMFPHNEEERRHHADAMWVILEHKFGKSKGWQECVSEHRDEIVKAMFINF